MSEERTHLFKAKALISDSVLLMVRQRVLERQSYQSTEYIYQSHLKDKRNLPLTTTTTSGKKLKLRFKGIELSMEPRPYKEKVSFGQIYCPASMRQSVASKVIVPIARLGDTTMRRSKRKCETE
uniref:Uncharacterized protein n=1 Tax=Glossina austeni TaxID=7395 RepID=A0A1A9UGT6_GLOAU